MSTETRPITREYIQRRQQVAERVDLIIKYVDSWDTQEDDSLLDVFGDNKPKVQTVLDRRNPLHAAEIDGMVKRAKELGGFSERLRERQAVFSKRQPYLNQALEMISKKDEIEAIQGLPTGMKQKMLEKIDQSISTLIEPSAPRKKTTVKRVSAATPVSENEVVLAGGPSIASDVDVVLSSQRDVENSSPLDHSSSEPSQKDSEEVVLIGDITAGNEEKVVEKKNIRRYSAPFKRGVQETLTWGGRSVLLTGDLLIRVAKQIPFVGDDREFPLGEDLGKGIYPDDIPRGEMTHLVGAHTSRLRKELSNNCLILDEIVDSQGQGARYFVNYIENDILDRPKISRVIGLDAALKENAKESDILTHQQAALILRGFLTPSAENLKKYELENVKKDLEEYSDFYIDIWNKALLAEDELDSSTKIDAISSISKLFKAGLDSEIFTAQDQQVKDLLSILIDLGSQFDNLHSKTTLEIMSELSGVYDQIKDQDWFSEAVLKEKTVRSHQKQVDISEQEEAEEEIETGRIDSLYSLEPLFSSTSSQMEVSALKKKDPRIEDEVKSLIERFSGTGLVKGGRAKAVAFWAHGSSIRIEQMHKSGYLSSDGGDGIPKFDFANALLAIYLLKKGRMRNWYPDLSDEFRSLVEEVLQEKAE